MPEKITAKMVLASGGWGWGMSGGFKLVYEPAGPTVQRFHDCDDPIRGLEGPFGSGKTSGGSVEVPYRGVRQVPSPIDNTRYLRHTFVRDTYRNLDKTTIPSWLTWFPKDLGEWDGGPPARHTIKFRLPDRTNVHLEVDFIALGERRVEDVMRGYETTSAEVDEADRMPLDVINFIRGRLGRYPTKQHGGASWYGIWLLFNAPDIENDMYKLFVEDPPDGCTLFQQPSGFSPQAENLQNLPDGYYQELARGQPEWWIRRYIRNQWGYSREGQPVFPEFNDQLHVPAEEIEPVEGLPLIIGADAGLDPCAAIRQIMPNGQKRTIDELVCEHGTGPTTFGERLNELMRDRYRGFKPEQISAWCDPSAIYGGDQEGGDPAWVDVVNKTTGIRFRPAPTNKITPRLEAVRQPMLRLIDGHTPGYLLSPRCKILRKAYNSAYRYRRKRLVGETQYDPLPEKNSASHPADADQYAALALGEYLDVTGRKEAQRHALNQTHAYDDDDEPMQTRNAPGRGSLPRRNPVQEFYDD